MRLDRWVQGYGAYGRSSARRLIASGCVMVGGVVVRDGLADVGEFDEVRIDGDVVQSREAYYLMLNKPAGCVSATVDSEHETVMDLLDVPYAGELHIAGRLDKESTGLLLLTNDGRWSRLITEPAEAIPKRYLVTTEGDIGLEDVESFREGFYFAYEDVTTLPAELEILTSRCARVVIYEGKYHQIKRMFHAVGNRVTSLHREMVGGIRLDDGLGEGGYRVLTEAEVDFW